MSKSKSSRKRIEQINLHPMAIAIRSGFKVESMDHLAGFTAGELEAYYWNLDWLVKEGIMAVHPEVGRVAFRKPTSTSARLRPSNVPHRGFAGLSYGTRRHCIGRGAAR
jgi:hypothetical protein